MKSFIKNLCFKITLITTIFSINSNTKAQTQSVLLPIPGSYITNPPDGQNGCKIMNFNNPSNPIITTLPKHDFDFGNSDPHLEYDLHAPATNPDNLYLFNEKYLGQHPMFAQQVVHDKDGNLLFFIVDNNIYNKYGKAFKMDPNDNDETAYYYYLHGDVIYAPNYNRFGFSGTSTPNPNISLDPEIVIVPIIDNQNPCNYKFRVVYSIFNCDAHSGASSILTRTLTYIDENHIELSPEELLSKPETIPVSQGACRDESVRNLAVSKYNNDEHRYVLFVRFYNYLSIFTVDEYGNIPRNNNDDSSFASIKRAKN